MPPGPPASGAIALEHLAEISVGPSARVDLCRAVGDAHQGRLLAVKRLNPEMADDLGAANRFLDEVWMTASLKHPNVVEVAGWGEDEQGTYLAVELVQGVSLARLMKTVFDTGEAFTERMVVYIAACVCRGLAAAHSLRAPSGELVGLVHRDLTPENVLIGFNGEVKIADFGLAKAKQRFASTTVGLNTRTRQQLAPEETRGRPSDHRADLFAVGVLAFELLAARRPWVADNELDVLMMMVKNSPADLRELRPKIDKEIVAIVGRCLEKEPEKRAQSAEEVVERLHGWLIAHGYLEDNQDALGRFVRRNAMRQMRWFERAVRGAEPARRSPPEVPRYTSPSGGSEGARTSRRSESTAVERRPGAQEPVDEPSLEEVSAILVDEVSAYLVEDVTDEATAPPAARAPATQGAWVPTVSAVGAEAVEDATVIQERPSIELILAARRQLAASAAAAAAPTAAPRPREVTATPPAQSAAPRPRDFTATPPAPREAARPAQGQPQPQAQSPSPTSAPGATGATGASASRASLPDVSAASDASATESEPEDEPTLALQRSHFPLRAPLRPAGAKEGALAPGRPVAPSAPVQPSAEALAAIVAEVERHRARAVSWAREAKEAAAHAQAAAERAERAAAHAKVAESAATTSEEALPLARSGAGAEATRRLDRARELAASLAPLPGDGAASSAHRTDSKPR